MNRHDAHAALEAWIAQHFDEEVRFLQALVRAQEEGEAAVQRRVAEAARRVVSVLVEIVFAEQSPADEQDLGRRFAAAQEMFAGGDVTAAEIGDDVDACVLGQHCRVLRLARVAHTVVRARLVANGLAVRADGTDFAADTAAFLQQLLDAFGIQAGERVGGQGFAMNLIVAGVLQVEKGVAQFRREGRVSIGHQYRMGTGEINQYTIDAVQAGAGHQADVELAVRMGGGRHAREHTSGGAVQGVQEGGRMASVGQEGASR